MIDPQTPSHGEAVTTSPVSTADVGDHPEKLFGVCQAIGDDLGFNPTYLRVALLALLVFSPLAMIGTYVALGGFVAASRLAFPGESADVPAAADAAAGAADHVEERELLAA